MACLGLVAAEDSSGGCRSQEAITKCGNSPARRVIRCLPSRRHPCRCGYCGKIRIEAAGENPPFGDRL